MLASAYPLSSLASKGLLSGLAYGQANNSSSVFNKGAHSRSYPLDNQRNLLPSGFASNVDASQVTIQASPKAIFNHIMNRLQEQLPPASSVYPTRQHYTGQHDYDSSVATGHDSGAKPINDQNPDDQALTRQSAGATASNILSFIERRLMSDAAGGANEEALQKRLKQGLDGFKQGFDLARHDLEGLGMLTSELDGNIGETYSAVLAGIDELGKKIGDIAAGTYSSISNKPLIPQESVVSSSTYAGNEKHQNNSFSFQLVTADGDKVTLYAQQRELSRTEQLITTQSAAGTTGSLVVTNTQQWQDSGFDLKVDGQLDDSELSAINDLLQKVGNLSEQFFAGNINNAFDQALALGYNENEISSFSLNLHQTTVQRMQSTYKDLGNGGKIASLDSINPQNVSSLLQPLGRFTADLTDMADQVRQTFPTVNDLIREMASLFERPDRASFSGLLGQLLEA